MSEAGEEDAGPLVRRAQPPARRGSGEIVAIVSILVAGLATYAPTLHNGFLQLGFDDAIIVDTAALHSLSAASLRAMATQFVHAHYVPLTMLSLAVDHAIWGLDPRGFHLTNVVLQALTGALAFWFSRRIAPSLLAAVVGALVFTVHPLQMEAVSLAIQRKTLLSGALFFVTLIFYQRWTEARRRGDYAAALLVFLAAGLAKPIVVCLPALLMLYDYCFVDGRLRLRDKVPFVIVAALVAVAAAAAHVAVGAVHAPHGGEPLAHALIVARATLESTAALFVPLDLSPVYYYRPGSAYSVFNALALLSIGSGALFLLLRRRHHPWSFFCFGWFTLALLPESNFFPLAQLRADRFLYLPLFGPALWIAVGLDRLPLFFAGRRGRLATLAAAAALVLTFAALSRDSARVWRNDVTAWRTVVKRHPWSATARVQLGVAQATRGATAAAEKLFLEAARMHPEMAAPHLELARLYHAHGVAERARAQVRRFIELAPDDPRGPQLSREIEVVSP